MHKAIVMPRISEDIRWLSEFTPELVAILRTLCCTALAFIDHFSSIRWTMYIYSTSRHPSPGFLIPPSTRGREAVPYLTFITTYYDNLPDYILFLHASPDEWHNDVLGPYTSQILTSLRLNSIDKHGYLNLRCTHNPGCPTTINPNNPTETDIANKDIRAYFAQAYREIFGVQDVPDQIGHPCCAQFAVSKSRILERKREEYERMLRWAVETRLTDSFGVGWVFEKLWHVIFGMPAI